MMRQDPSIFRTDDQLSAWTERLAQAIPYPSMQFDARNRGRVKCKSRLYYNLVPNGYVCLDVYAPRVNIVDGCVVFVIAPGMDDYPMVIVSSNDDYAPAVEAFNAAAADLPDGLRLAVPGEAVAGRKDGLDDRQLIEFGRQLHEARTGNPFPAGVNRKGYPSRKGGRSRQPI